MTERAVQIIEDCWAIEGRALTAKHGAAMQELQAWLIAQSNPVAIALTQDPTHSWTKAEMRDLERDVIAAFRPVRRAHAMFGYLRYVAQRCNARTHNDCPLPRISYLHRRATNPIKRDPAKALRQYDQARTEIYERIAELSKPAFIGAPARDSDWLALAIVSGVLSFGLLHRDCIFAAVAALANPMDSFLSLGQHVALRLALPVQGIPNSEHRIWIPDPLTATLLLRVDAEDAHALIASTSYVGASQRQQGRTLHAVLVARVARAIQISETEKRCKGFSLAMLLYVSTQAARYWLPFNAAAYLTRKFISHSLRPEVLARIDPSVQLLSFPLAKVGTANTTSSTKDIPSALSSNDATSCTGTDLEHSGLIAIEPGWLTPIRGALRGDSASKIRRSLVELLRRNDLPPAAVRLAEFALALKSQRNAKTMRPATLQTYIRLLAKHLGPRFGDDDPIEIARTGVEDLYLEAIEDHADSPSGRSLSSQRRFGRCVLMFHRFLVDKYQAKPLEELGGLALGCLPVDANIISEEEFLRVLATVRSARTIPAGQRIVALMLLILGYRCGLRRSEAYYLRVCDIDAGDPVLLSLRDTDVRKLKTANAQRRLNLSALMPEELPLLLDFHGNRRPQVNALDRLFPVRNDNEKWLDEDALFTEMHRILRRELGDETLRYHLLRHSFSTWTALRLMAPHVASLQSMLPGLRLAAATLEDPAAFRLSLYQSSAIQGIDLQSISDMLGHGSPKMSLEHYIHCFDLLIAAHLMAQPALAPPRQIVIAVSAIPKTTAYRLAGAGLSAIPLHSFRVRFREQIAQVNMARKQYALNKTHEAKAAVATDPFAQALHFIRLLPDRNLTFEEVCSRAGLTLQMGRDMEQQLAGVLQRYAGANDRQSRRIVPTEEIHLSRRDQAIVADIAPRLAALRPSKPRLLQRALVEFPRHYWPSYDACIFRGLPSVTRAREYLRLLRLLGIPAEQIRIIHFSAKGSRIAERWHRSLCCPDAAVVFRHPPNANSAAARTWIGIAPLFPQATKNSATRLRAASGFSTLMLFAYAAMQPVEDGYGRKQAHAAGNWRMHSETG